MCVGICMNACTRVCVCVEIESSMYVCVYACIIWGGVFYLGKPVICLELKHSFMFNILEAGSFRELM